ncbi:50S ribosomal protein L21e [Candidatus Woesearchaeota archaeon]|jgi:large subunit ribosomal protein L21e|nr:50S ribosomal protein L21e [Candidatus Woesearchaeota archaeon]
MVSRIGGTKRKTRHKLTKHFRDKGKVPLSKFFQELSLGDKVVLKVNPTVQKGLYHFRFHSKVGTIKAKRGNCYQVTIKDGGKPKLLNVHPVHLRKL